VQTAAQWGEAGDAARDQPAADLIMGHADESMATIDRQRIGWDRLVAVAEVVREAVFAARDRLAG